MARAPEYTIQILEYARISQQTAEAVYSGYAHQGETRYFPFTFVLVQGGGQNILIDCGIDVRSATKQTMAEGFGLESWRSSGEVLAAVGLTVEEIDVIIPTHAHWDHMGSLRMFPNALVYVQRAERDGWRSVFGLSDKYASLLVAMDRDDIDCLDDIEREGRLRLLDGEVQNLLPGIHIWVDWNGHTHASQLVLIESGADPADRFIVVGDVVYSLDNLTGVEDYPHFIPNTKWAIGGPYSTMRTYERILEYVGSDLSRVLIEHDAATWDRHPTREWRPGLHIASVRASCAIEPN